MSQTHAESDNEFARVTGPGEAGPAASLPTVRRAWVNVPTGGHVSAVIWGKAQPEIVFLHDARRSARAWDQVALEIGRPAAAIDLPGHGRSNWRRDGRYEPRRLAPAVAEAIRSFAPRARLVAGEGLGGLTALAIAQRHPALLPAVALVDTLPATQSPGVKVPDPDSAGEQPVASRVPEPRAAGLAAAPRRFASPGEARALLAERHPDWPDLVLLREVRTELDAEPDGRWAWRHHPGNLPDAARLAFDDPSLWAELAGLGDAASLIRGDRSARLTQAHLDELSARAPRANVITIPGVAHDVTVHAPAALAARLRGLLDATASTGPASTIPATAERGRP